MFRTHAPHSPRRAPGIRLVVAIAVAVMSVAALAPAVANAQVTQEQQGTSKKFTPEPARWAPCYQDLQQEFFPDEFADLFGGKVRYECASVRVPFEYNRPNGKSRLLSVVRIPATNQRNKIGSLFTNPGGPGASGVEFVVQSAPIAFGPEIRERFDIVGFDPRGVGQSKPAKCFRKYNGAVRRGKVLPWEVPYPTSSSEVGQWLAADASLQRFCDGAGNQLLDHMSTANVARDLNALRKAVGDKQLTFVGYSYGSMIGATYANLFPNKVRAIALDSALDPIEWTTGTRATQNLPMTARIGSHVGSAEALERLFELCDAAGPDECDLAPNSSQRFNAVLAELKREPLVEEVELPDPDTGEVTTREFTYTEAMFLFDVHGMLYGGDFGWIIATLLTADVEAAVNERANPRTSPDGGEDRQMRTQLALGVAARGTGPDSARPSVHDFGWEVEAELSQLPQVTGFDSQPAPETPTSNEAGSFYGVLCADGNNPTSPAAWQKAAAATAKQSVFGPLWTWTSSVCSQWPATDRARYTGPWNRPTANPALVINTEFDPATPLAGAQQMASALAGAKLVTVKNGRGHIASVASDCAKEATERYLLNPNAQLPSECDPNIQNPFLEIDLGPEGKLTLIIEGPDGEERRVESVVVDGQLIQVPVVFPAVDGSIIVIEPVVVPNGTAETVVVETAFGPIELEPIIVATEAGEIVTIEANVIENAVIIEEIWEPIE